MPRKSIADVLSERHGGKWAFDRKTSDRWHCDDGIRTVVRTVKCMCWAIPGYDGPCRCKPTYTLSENNQSTVIDVSDPRVYRLNGKNTYN